VNENQRDNEPAQLSGSISTSMPPVKSKMLWRIFVVSMFDQSRKAPLTPFKVAQPVHISKFLAAFFNC